MKVLNICMSAPYTEGYSYQDNLLSEYQHKLGHDVTVFTSTRTRVEGGRIISVPPEKKTMANGVHLVRLPAPGKLLCFLGIYPGLGKAIAAEQPDFIMIHGLATFVPVPVLRYKRKRPDVHVIADSHQDRGTTYTDQFPFNLQIKLFAGLWKRWIKSVDKVYGTTSWRKTFAKEYYRIPEEKLDVLIMGIDSDQLPKDRDAVRNQVRTDLGIESNAFVFVTGGKLDPNKRILESMEAFSSLKNDHAVFLIFGSISESIREEFYRMLHEDRRIIYIGYIESNKAKEIFLAADFGVFPGRHSVLWEEAIGCGLPCLFCRYEERDHTEPCENCIRLLEPTVERIHDMMAGMADDGIAYSKIKANAENAAELFSYRAIAEKSIECGIKD